MKVYRDYLAATNDHTYTVIASTASPFKFASNVLTGLEGEKQKSWGDEWEALDYLSQLTGWKIPQGLQGLNRKPAKTVDMCEPEGITGLLQIMFA